MELINDQGLRVDGRRPEDLRLISCKMGVYEHADGSAYLEQGNTKVLAAVFGPGEVRNTHKSKAMPDSVYLNCQYKMSAFSKSERRVPRNRDRKFEEMNINLHQALVSVIRTELLAKSQIDLVVEVLSADGGNDCAAINAATLALIDAGVPLKEYVVSCSASLGNGNLPMVDVNHVEQTMGGPSLTIAMLPLSRQIVFMEMSQRFHVDHLEKVLNMAEKGCLDTYEILDKSVKFHLVELGQLNKYGQG